MPRDKPKIQFYSLKLSLILLAVFLAQLLSRQITDAIVLDRNSFAQPWRFLTAVFAHANLLHLVLNLFALLLFGTILEGTIGSKRFLIVFISSGIFANLVAVNFYPRSLGASGAIFGVIASLAVLRPNLVVWAFGVPMPLFLAATLWIAGDLLGAYGYLIGNPINNTGNIAHLSGTIVGFAYAFAVKKKFRRQARRRARFDIPEEIARAWEERYVVQR